MDAPIEPKGEESMIGWKPPSPTSGFTFNQIWHGIHTFEGMENPWEMEIELTENTTLCHSTTCGRLIQMLRDAADEGARDGSTIKIKGRESPVNYTGANLVWTAVQLTDKERAAIPDSCAGKGDLIASSKGYGSACLQFLLGHALLGGPRKHAHILSTRQFGHEYSQAILVAPFEQLFIRRDKNCEGEHDNDEQRLHFEAMDSLLGYKWKLGFSKEDENKSWTFPELVFHGDLEIPLNKVKISFNDHKCGVVGKNCDDCGQSAADSRQKFERLLCEEAELLNKYHVHEVKDELNLQISRKNSFT